MLNGSDICLLNCCGWATNNSSKDIIDVPSTLKNFKHNLYSIVGRSYGPTNNGIEADLQHQYSSDRDLKYIIPVNILQQCNLPQNLNIVMYRSLITCLDPALVLNTAVKDQSSQSHNAQQCVRFRYHLLPRFRENTKHRFSALEM